MPRLQEAEGLISSMTAGEKAQLLRWLTRDFDGASPGMESDPEVAGGEPCILRTRIPIWVLVQARKLGASEMIGQNPLMVISPWPSGAMHIINIGFDGLATIELPA